MSFVVAHTCRRLSLKLSSPTRCTVRSLATIATTIDNNNNKTSGSFWINPFIDRDFQQHNVARYYGTSTTVEEEQNKLPLDVVAKKVTSKFSLIELDDKSLTILGALGDHSAHQEILKRHIMIVDNVSYDIATKTFHEISKKNDENVWFISLPYKIGIFVAITAGVTSIPLVFHQHTAEWFNTYFVTSDIPEPKDMETFYEVGSWSWNWMEPPLGTISFLLLTMQYARAQLENLGYKPYTQLVKLRRAKALAAAFPKYDAKLIINFSQGSDFFRHTIDD